MIHTDILSVLKSLRELKQLQSYYDADSTFILTNFNSDELDIINAVIVREMTLHMEILKEKIVEEVS